MERSTGTQTSLSATEQHSELERRIADLEAWRIELCQMGQPRFDELGIRLREIGRVFEGHFAAEEESEPLAAVVEAAPQLASQVEALPGQQVELHVQFDALVQDRTAAPVRFADWDRSCVACGRFLNALQSHEEAANALIPLALVRSDFETDVRDAE